MSENRQLGWLPWTIHTPERYPGPDGVRRLAGVVVTSPERSIVDALEAGAPPEQIDLAVRQALDRGLTTSRRLRAEAASRSTRVRQVIERAIDREAG